MARNLVLFDPSDNEWCVFAQVGTIGDEPQCIVSFYKTEAEAKEAAKSLRERTEVPVNVRVFKYSYAKDDGDILKLLFLDTVDVAIKFIAG